MQRRTLARPSWGRAHRPGEGQAEAEGGTSPAKAPEAGAPGPARQRAAADRPPPAAAEAARPGRSPGPGPREATTGEKVRPVRGAAPRPAPSAGGDWAPGPLVGLPAPQARLPLPPQSCLVLFLKTFEEISPKAMWVPFSDPDSDLKTITTLKRSSLLNPFSRGHP